MKKVTALLICLILSLSFCGCKEKKESKVEGADIEYYANVGQIPESEIRLSNDPDKVLSKLRENQNSSGLESHDSDEEGEQAEIPVIETGDYSEIAGENFQYYYKTADKNSGITAITATAAAFGYEPDTVIIEIEADLDSKKIKYETKSGNFSDYYFFSFSADPCEFLICEFDKNTVVFAFTQSKLCAAAVYAK